MDDLTTMRTDELIFTHRGVSITWKETYRLVYPSNGDILDYDSDEQKALTAAMDRCLKIEAEIARRLNHG